MNMKRKNSQEPGKTENRAQLILIGGLVIAVAVVAIALVVGGGLFSQSTNDDGGLSSFTSQTADQLQAAVQVGEKSLNYNNVNSTLFQGSYPDQLCGELVDSAQVQQVVSTQLGEGESVVDIEVANQDCGNNTLKDASWVVGQTNSSYELPSVNSTSGGGGTQTVTCADLNEDTNFDEGSVQNEWAEQIVANNGGTVPQPVDVDGVDKKQALEDVEALNSTALTLDPIRGFEGLEILEYAETCTSYDVTEGRDNVDVVLAIDTTGSMGLDRNTAPDPDYNSDYDDDFSPSKVETPRTQRHKETYTTDSGRTYTRSDPFNLRCYKEYSETDTEFPRGGSYGDTDESNQDWCEGAFFGDDFNASVGGVGDYVYWTDGNEIVRVVSLPTGGPPAGIPEDWTQLTTPGIETDDESQYPVGAPNDCDSAECETRTSDPGSVSAGDVLEVDHSGLTTEINVDVIGDEPVTAEVKQDLGIQDVESGGFFGCGFFGCEEDRIWEVEYDGSTYEVREDALSVFEFRWEEIDSDEVTVEDEAGNEFEAETDELDYVEYRWWTPDRLYLTQAGARTAIDDLLDTSEPDKRDSVGLVEYTTALGGDARTIQSLKELDSGYANTLKKDIDSLRPGSGTNIKAGIEEGIEVLDGSNPNKTDHIILMTDGQNTPGEPDPVNYVEGNSDIQGSLDDGIAIHSIALGEGADKGTMKELGNDPDDPPPGGTDDDRPNGTFIASEDPSDAEGIFEDIVSEIQAIGDGDDDANAGTGNPNASFSTSPTANTGTVQEIKDVRMNVSDFQGNGTYRMSFVGDVDNNGDDELIWRIVVDNKFVASPNPSPGEGYEVEFVGGPQEPSILNQTVTVPDTEGNLSDSDNYAWFDLTGEDPTKPRLDVPGASSPDSHVIDGWKEVEKELGTGPTDGVDIVVKHRGPNGPDNPPIRRGTVRGAFSMEFEPKDGDFEDIGQMTGGNFTDDCDAANATDLPSRCGLNDAGNNRSAVSTTQIDEIELEVTVESPEGRSKKRVKIPPGNKEFDFDIFDP